MHAFQVIYSYCYIFQPSNIHKIFAGHELAVPGLTASVAMLVMAGWHGGSSRYISLCFVGMDEAFEA
jgi:hypothetical protein